MSCWKDDVYEFAKIGEDERVGQLLPALAGSEECFLVSSGDTVLSDLRCAALEGLTLQQLTQASAGKDASPTLRRSGRYCFVPIRTRQTVSQATAAHKLSPQRSFYEVVGSKSEFVSAEQALLLLTGELSGENHLLGDAAAVRAQLRLGAGDASISAAQVREALGDDSRLFVEVTMNRRPLLPASTLCCLE